MIAFTRLASMAVPLLRDNIDTDTIIPSREITSTARTGLADGLFAPWRYTHDRVPDPAFALNRPDYAGAQILVAGANFGCGSSREHAVWALLEYGIRAVIAPGFAPIFRNNCIRNGLLPVVLDAAAVAMLAGAEVTVDLAAQQVSAGGRHWAFEIDGQAKAMLLGGLEAIDLTLHHAAAIAAFHQADRVARPWVYLKGGAA